MQYFKQSGRDISAYENAVFDLFSGVNPYIRTVASYSVGNTDLNNHGYAYLPVLMYVYSFLYAVYSKFGVSYQALWKTPILIADLGVGLILVKRFFNKNFLYLIFSLFVWFFNPYLYYKHNYVYSDPFVVFMLLVSLYYLGVDDVISGTCYMLSIGLKSFGLIFFPLYLFKANDKKRFILAVLIIAVLISPPFLRSFTDFKTYLRGALFVHSSRFVEGRPLLYYISYFYHIEFFRTVPFKIYVYLAALSSWSLLIYIHKYKVKLFENKYISVLFPFTLFYIFTPVLNRTYFMWFVPFLILGSYQFFELFKDMKFKYRVVKILAKYNIPSFVVVSLYWLFYLYYLIPWKDGFHIWHPI